MAPPKNRRPGFSRRAQFGLFLGYVIAVGGAVIAALLLVVSVVDPRGFSGLRGVALDVTTPVASAGRSVVGFFSGIGDGISNWFRAGSQNGELREELEAARRELIRRQALEHENRRLLAALGLAQATGDEVTVARIVGSTWDSPRRLATLSAGSAAGVLPGQPVRSADGLIGRVLETGRWASRVMLVTDGASNVPVRLVRDGTPALAVGRGDGTIELRTLEVGQNPFRRGDVLVTSGIGGLFPPNIPVALVTASEGDTAIARPIADPARMDYAIVQRVFQPAAAGPLELARPQPPAPPVTGPPAPMIRPGQQNNPRYQPALQQPQPGMVAPPRAAATPAR
ncbi:MAG: rod shape-determining protein MreC [Sphingomonadales bacterium]|jgi:rod shape-determining protein MreC|nr:rod shape-determining protein MreC [Sphingomonadales bacterium]MEA3043735.1 rod shape-determining protein MreC [Sphingomonadales bacterium]